MVSETTTFHSETIVAIPADLDVAEPKPSRPSITVEKPTPYTFDLGNLLAIDPNPLSSTTESSLRENAREGAQVLINQLLTTCPIRSTPAGVLLTLPNPSTPLPREKRVPITKAKTKWEVFAAKKGIKSKAREGKMVYDEATGEWLPKYGYKGANKKDDDQWIVEVDDKDDGKKGEARTQGRRERKESIRRNERKERANDRRGRKHGS